MHVYIHVTIVVNDNIFQVSSDGLFALSKGVCARVLKVCGDLPK